MKNLFLLLLCTAFSLKAESLLPAQKTIRFTTDEVTWPFLDISPDESTLIFDMLGDIYTMPAEGGKASLLLGGMAFEYHPVYSPDGKQIAFISDRDGSINLWIANADGSAKRKLSSDKEAMMYATPAWSADGESVYVSKMHYSLLAFEIYQYTLSGKVNKITDAKPNGSEGFDTRLNAMAVSVSDDGSQLIYSRKSGTTWSPQVPAKWQLISQSATGNETVSLVRDNNSLLNPLLSHGGDFLLFAAHHDDTLDYKIRDLQTGKERWLGLTLDQSGEEGGYYTGLLPRAVLTRDDKTLITNINGKFRRIELATGEQTTLPFEADVALEARNNTRVQIAEETGAVENRTVQGVSVQPDTGRIAFSAFGKLYLAGKGDDVLPMPTQTETAFQPSWSHQGGQLVFVTWSSTQSGSIRVFDPANGKPAKKISQYDDTYYSPVFSADDKIVYALRANQQDRLNTQAEVFQPVENALIKIDLSTGRQETLIPRINARHLALNEAGDRLFADTAGGFKSVSLAQPGDVTTSLIVDMSGNQYIEAKLPAEAVRRSPDGKSVLVRSGAKLYFIDGTELSADTPFDLSMHVDSLIIKGGVDDFGWLSSTDFYWLSGNTWHRGTVDNVNAQTVALSARIPRDIPEQSLLLRGAKILTMASPDAVIEQGDLLIENNRIRYVGESGTAPVTAETKIMDLSGKTLIPGLIDAHAHWMSLNRTLPDLTGQWEFMVNLAYGVTSGLDVQTFTPDTFFYQDAIDAGLITGPRAFSTGPGIFRNSRIHSVDDAKAILGRYKNDYRTQNLKSYMVGNRLQQQMMQAASEDMSMMPTTEGASNLRLNLLHAIDGFSGNEHNLPVSPLHNDVLSLYAQSGISYTPTLTVLYGGAAGLYDFIAQRSPYKSAKLHHFIPNFILQKKTTDLPRFHRHSDRRYPSFAQDAIDLQRRGGVVAMGSHGEMQGIGMHWEMAAYTEGGATPREAIYAATMGSATAIGRQQFIGSLESGKLADILILNDDPDGDITRTEHLSGVIKNGRLYDPQTLDEHTSGQRKAPAMWFQRSQVKD